MELRRFLLLGFGLAGSTLLCCAALDEPPHLAMDDAIAVNEPIGGDDLSRDAGTVFSSPGLLSRLSQLLIGGRPQVDGDNLANFMFENNGATPGVDGALRESPKDAILDEYMTRRLHSAPANVKDALKEVSHVAKHVNKAAHITKRHEAKTHHQTILKSPRRRPSRQSPRPHSSRQSDHNPTHNSSNFSEIGQGWCLDASNEWYSFVSSPLLIGRTADTYCLNWCSQIPHKDLVAVEVSRDYSYVQCLCDFTGGVPNDVNLTDYAPAAEFYHDYYGVGAVQTSNGNSGAVCYRNDNFKNSYPASAVKIELKTGKNINMFEVEAIANTGYNVAAGKPSNQSSTFKGFNASLAVDGKPNTFSLTDVAAQTAGSPVWWKVDLGNEFRIESVNIKNRWCKNSTDPDGCLCRLSNATLALLDGQGTVVATQSVGNACGQQELSFMDLSPPIQTCEISTSSRKLSFSNANDGSDVNGIVGGIETEVGRYPYVVGLTARRSDFPYCGGSLVAPDTVLTAAHCIQGGVLNYVAIGGHNVSDWEGEVIAMAKTFVHPYNDGWTNTYDFAIVVLDNATTQNNIKFIKLNNDESYPSVGSISRVMGWGVTTEGGSQSDVPLEVDLPIISNDDCGRCYSQSDIDSSMICTFDPGHDSCQGDSGGPLIIPGATPDEDVQFGIVSWGNGCARNLYPGVNARVSKGFDWLKKTICKESSFPPTDLCDGSYAPTPPPPSYAPTFSPEPTSGGISGFSRVGRGNCLDASDELYPYAVLSSLPDDTTDIYCLNWCSQNTHPDFVGVEVFRDEYFGVDCGCKFTREIPSDIDIWDAYIPAPDFSIEWSTNGVGAIQTSGGSRGIVCYRNDNFKLSYPASAVKIELSTGKDINVFEVEAIANAGYNVAAGKPSNQSSTSKGFNASLAVDGKPDTFSLTDVGAQTAGSPVWWEVDLGNEFRIESVNIKNRWCKTSTDPDGCLCRLSNATLALLDGQGTVVATQSVGNACGQHELSLMDFIPVDLPTDGDDYYYDDYYYDDYFSSVPTSSYEPTSSPGPSSSPVVGFSRDGAGYCVNALNEWYSYVGSPYLPNDTTDTYCLHWCSQIPHPELVGVEVFREYWGVECICDFAGGIPNDISLTDYTPAAIFNDTFNGVGAIQTSDGVSYVVCYRNDNFKLPASKPTKRPTKKPTSKPTNKTPTKKPTKQPTKRPTKKPTSKPTNAPTNKPTTFPTKKPTSKPTISPTKRPTTSPTKKATSKTSKVTN